MRLCELFGSGPPVFSIELFPPKTEQGLKNLQARLKGLSAFPPDYVSVTYGAGGGTRHNTLAVCEFLKHTLKLEVMAHLTCVSHTRAEIQGVLEELRAVGIDNIMALRGDPPQGEETFRPPQGGFNHAVDLVEAVRAADGFGIGIAGYPEGHVEAVSYRDDLGHQVAKVRAGGEVMISQFFLDNQVFLRWRDDLRRAGVEIPIEAGVLPALSATQIIQFATLCGVGVPAGLLADLEKCGDDKEASAAVGLEHALGQIEGLLAEGVDGIHLYALNRLEPIAAVEPLVRGR